MNIINTDINNFKYIFYNLFCITVLKFEINQIHNFNNNKTVTLYNRNVYIWGLKYILLIITNN